MIKFVIRGTIDNFGRCDFAFTCKQQMIGKYVCFILNQKYDVIRWFCRLSNFYLMAKALGSLLWNQFETYGNLYVMMNTYIMHKVQDYNNSVHPVTCKGQHLTRMIKTHDLTFY